MGIVTILVSLFVVQILASSLPGPDMLVVMRNSIKYGRTYGVAAALGTTTVMTMYCVFAVFFISAVHNEYLMIFRVISCLGALYLLRLSYLCFKSAKNFHFKKSIDKKKLNAHVVKPEYFITSEHPVHLCQNVDNLSTEFNK